MRKNKSRSDRGRQDAYLKFAVAVCSAMIENSQVPVAFDPVVTVQEALVTLGAVPPQAVKLNPGEAVAVRVTSEPLT